MRPIRTLVLGNVNLGYSWFVLGVTQGAHLHRHWVKTLDIKLNSLRFIQQHIDWFKPNFLLTHITFHKAVDQAHGKENLLEVFSQARKRHGTKVCYHMGDARTTPRYAADISAAFDLGLVNSHNVAVLREFSETWRIPTIWWPYAALVQPEIAAPAADLACDLAYTGNMDTQHVLYRRRTAFVHKLAACIPTKVFETQKDGDLRFRTPELSTSAKALLSLPADGDVPGYIDVRPFQYGGAGALLLQRWTPALARVFDKHEHMLAFEGYNVGAAKEAWQLGQDVVLGTKRREAIFKLVQAEHSYFTRIQRIVDFFKEGK